jgi:E3 ubiquitin-protein ligase MARCH6
MRGPLYVVAQNVWLRILNAMCDSKSASQAALMIFVLDTAVGLGVWLPFTFGKSTALLSVSRHLYFPESPT